MSDFRYTQFCPVARAAEILGERWTLLIIRELLLGPIRFRELRRHLSEVSPSVLSARVQSLEARGLVVRRELPPPASVWVFELTELGQSLRPVMLALVRFGVQLLDAPQPGDHFEPRWLRMGIAAVARTSASPEIAFAVTIKDGEGDFTTHLRGSPEGTIVRNVPVGEDPEADVFILAEGMVVMAMASGALDPATALANQQIEVTGSIDDLACFSQLFHFGDADRVEPGSAR